MLESLICQQDEATNPAKHPQTKRNVLFSPASAKVKGNRTSWWINSTLKSLQPLLTQPSMRRMKWPVSGEWTAFPLPRLLESDKRGSSSEQPSSSSGLPNRVRRRRSHPRERWSQPQRPRRWSSPRLRTTSAQSRGLSWSSSKPHIYLILIVQPFRRTHCLTRRAGIAVSGCLNVMWHFEVFVAHSCAQSTRMLIFLRLDVQYLSSWLAYVDIIFVNLFLNMFVLVKCLFNLSGCQKRPARHGRPF